MRSVYSWSEPPENKLDGSPVAAWIDKRTLIFAEPGDWKNSLPQQVQLQRLTLNPDGTADVGTLTTLRTHGNERGVSLEELAVSQQTGIIAYRLRHFTQSSVDRGTFDSVAVATLAHIDSPLELSRQGSGTGIDWSPDGKILVTVVGGEIRFYSTNGVLLGRVTGMSDATSPLWLSPSEVWFGATQDGVPTVMSVPVR